MKLSFTKMHGCANDYIYLDCRATGLGLFLCRRILERLNHRAELTSAPGRGTTVRLFLAREKLEVE